MSRRFYAESPITSETAVLTGQEAQHLSKVMRAKVGDELILFDGGGAEFPARIERIGRSEVGLSIIEKCEVDRELSFRLVLGVALPKGDRQRWLVEKLVELGVAELVPLVTARGIAQPSGNALQRLRRTVVEASKQCGRNRLMVVGHARTFAEFVGDASDSCARLIAHPAVAGETAAAWSIPADQVVGAIGPEGGFTEEEVSLANERGWNKISLGPRVLRTETAAVAIASVIALRDKSND
jgi:16S rRNA (uracil1498-N3)-methyltransferase